jgi:ADP-heptose:LPS heptosyltransferase
MRKRFERRGKRLLARSLAPLLGARGPVPDQLDPQRIGRLLVIRQHNQMGDMLLAVPALRGIRRRFPSARITLIAAPINAAVVENNPYVDEVLTWSKERSRRDPLALPRFIAWLRRRRFDLVIVLGTVSFSVTSMLLAAVSGARVRAGSTGLPFGVDLARRYYHIELPLPAPAELASMHESEHNLYPLAALGVVEHDLSSLLVPSPAEERDAAGFARIALGGPGRYIVVHPGAGKAANVWPPERFARAAGELCLGGGFSCAAVRGPVDGPVFDRFLAAGDIAPQVLSMPPVGMLGALMREAAVCLCNDTGVAHIAGAVGARCVEVFGPTDPSRWKPVSPLVTAVRAPDGDIGAVTVEEVVEAAGRLLTAPGRG